MTRESDERVQGSAAAASDGLGDEALRSFVRFVVSVLEEKRAEDIVVLDVHDVTDLADYFLIATIGNPRQSSAVIEACERERKARGLPRIGVEGGSGATWTVLDYGALIVHLLDPEKREYYALENLWADAKPVSDEFSGS